MIQVFLGILQFLAMVFFGLAAIVLAVVAVMRRKRKPYLFAGLAVASGALALFIWSFDIFTAETTDRLEAAEAFHFDFGFYPPSSVRDIKVKNTVIYDAASHYLAFTYEDWVFYDVLMHEHPLQTAKASSAEFKAIQADYERDQNRPSWAELPAGRTNAILYKRDFMRHSSSDYYLWVDTLEGMVHLRVSYFD